MIDIVPIRGPIADRMRCRRASARSIPGAAIEVLRTMRKLAAPGEIIVRGPAYGSARIVWHPGGSVAVVEISDTRQTRNGGVRLRDEYTMHDLRRIHRREWSMPEESRL